MSDIIHHECGIALIRLLRPLEYYLRKYGTSFYAVEKLHLLMQKQHNRGQDGAGIACIKLDMEPGYKYINRIRSGSKNPLPNIFNQVYDHFEKAGSDTPQRLKDVRWLKNNLDFTGELFLGHLRYGTYGKNELHNLHPVMRENNWRTRNLVLAGNFNLTNVDELFDRLIEYGQHPVETSDTITILEKIGHFLDEENERLYRKFKKEGHSKKEISRMIADQIDVANILKRSSGRWDGGYTIAGMLGHGDAFVMRDPAGIRPAWYYCDEEVAVAASERSVIQTAFNLDINSIREVQPGHALIIKRDGHVSEQPCKKPLKKKACSFERIYFSRGNDRDIYLERKSLGKLLTPAILEAVDHDLDNTVFSYIPNTAAAAFRGMIDELHDFCNGIIKDRIMSRKENISREELDRIFSLKIRSETIAVKDVKLRTFITQESERDELAGHVYDVTYGVIRNGKDNLVVLDDSIVRGTTLKQSIIRILDRLNPKRIVVASSAPQIRYPDCYGIDMARLGDFIAFRAAIALLHDTQQTHIINSVYKKSKAQEDRPREEIVNYVKEIYEPFTAVQISQKIAEMLTTPGISSEIRIVYQTIGNLHLAIPEHTGDWYFTGNYPTPGGNKVANRSFINYIEGISDRAY